MVDSGKAPRRGFPAKPDGFLAKPDGAAAQRVAGSNGPRVLRVVLAGALVTGVCLAYLGCARTDLDPADIELGESREPNTVVDAGPDAPMDVEDADVEDVEDADVEDVEDADVPDVPMVDADVEDVQVDVECEPSAEVCNGVDDDCDGDVDEVPPVECDDGGFSYCIAGAMSECPRQCETCMPGSETICFVTYCYFWGVQTCAADGKSLSGCKEEPPPEACREIAQKNQKSRQLEQCCIDEGFCCKDDFDLDKDGDTSDYVGTCSEVLCGED